MTKAEETRREKAKNLRHRKAIVKDINLSRIQEQLYDIWEECENVRWYWDGDNDTLLNALDGDEEQEYEFKMMFADLCADCEKMQEDLRDTYLPECFDDFFVAIRAGSQGGGLLGYDNYEGDYFGLSWDYQAERESRKRLMRLTKDQMIEAAHICFSVLYAYVGLCHRYDCLKSALDILKDENTGYLQAVKEIEAAYDMAENENFCGRATNEYDRRVNCMPQMAWLQ